MKTKAKIRIAQPRTHFKNTQVPFISRMIEFPLSRNLKAHVRMYTVLTELAEFAQMRRSFLLDYNCDVPRRASGLNGVRLASRNFTAPAASFLFRVNCTAQYNIHSPLHGRR
ncbi:hypothetical protein SBOR_4161 [Sclerotinia borealis F-4128]|uniref:Uncharacterized protein n=1 Tax=Sclerotinia borealis (strain F-4128) TaxID=1432307 RepID=W9CLP5_SCLBF|nr:hypothetical protein SBOR_4161 [Sclerotinia borealis F-4128]